MLQKPPNFSLFFLDHDLILELNIYSFFALIYYVHILREMLDSVGECATRHITLSITYDQSYDSRFCSTINFIQDYFRQQSPYVGMTPIPSFGIYGGIL